MAKQDDARDGSEKPVVTPLEEGFTYEDEHGSITVHKNYMRKLGIKNGDVVIVKRFPGLTVQAIEWLAEELGKKGFDECIVAVVDKLSDVKSFDEEMMNKYGWFRYGTGE